MEYQYGNLSYSKRALTEDLVLKIVGSEYRLISSKAEKYAEKTESMKGAEEAGQADSCPIAGRAELSPVLTALRGHNPEFRARKNQIGTALCLEQETSVTEEEADFLIACGSLALLAPSFDRVTKKILLSRGILPLCFPFVLPEGTFLFVEGIRNSMEKKESELLAYQIAGEHLEAVPLRILLEPEDDLAAVLE